MIAFLRGKIECKEERFLTVDVNGLGYNIFCSKKTLDGAPEAGEEAKIFTRLVVKEDSLELYGFLNLNELDLFEKLLTISGIGPRAALNLASFESIGQLKDALSSGKKAFPGIGPRKVQKILFELGEGLDQLRNQKKVKSPVESEAAEALVSLGVPSSRAREIVSEIPKEIEGVENIVKEALKRLGR